MKILPHSKCAKVPCPYCGGKAYILNPSTGLRKCTKCARTFILK